MSVTTTYDVLPLDAFEGQLGGQAEGQDFATYVRTLVAAIQDDFDTVQAQTGMPDVYGIDGGAPAAAGGDIVILGADMLQGMTFDTIDIAGSSTAVLTVTALTPGVSGLSVEIGEPAGGAAAVAVADGVITITPALAGSTVAEMATAVNANSADTDGLVRATVAGSGNFTVAVAEASMAGGTGDYAGTFVKVGGIACLPANETGTTPTAKWSATSLTVTVPALTATWSAGDIAKLDVSVNGVKATALSAALA